MAAESDRGDDDGPPALVETGARAGTPATCACCDERAGGRGPVITTRRVERWRRMLANPRPATGFRYDFTLADALLLPHLRPLFLLNHLDSDMALFLSRWCAAFWRPAGALAHTVCAARTSPTACARAYGTSWPGG